MDTDVLSFFDQHMDSLAFYEAFESNVRKEITDMRIKVQKTQISFYNRHLFACVSFARGRRKKDCPKNYIVITFGLNYKLESLRIEAVSDPYPNRWTHHVLISDLNEIDDELIGWIKEVKWHMGSSFIKRLDSAKTEKRISWTLHPRQSRLIYNLDVFILYAGDKKSCYNECIKSI